ncbi:MAG TPA: hypothetical protein VJR89_25430 [Polyangiales bacterium]|nr:hypothetical protein [Polyangiales bacterium]
MNTRWREISFFLLVGWTCTPLWIPHYLPIQDLPQHLAAIRVLHSWSDPQFGFQQYFELSLFRTQYLVYYLAAHLLGFVFDLELANRLLVTACVAATPYALRSLLRALDHDERLALLALPLSYNAHLILGFVNFLMAIPLAIWGLAIAVREREQTRLPRAVGLTAIALACFYAHVVPFALFALGVALLALGSDLRALVRRLLPLVPAGIAGFLWVLRSPAGQATVSAARGAQAGPQPVFMPAAFALADLPNWLTDILQPDADGRLLRWFALCFALTLFAGVLPSTEPRPSALRKRLIALPLAAAVLYFEAPTAYDWIWPIAQRFPLLALLFAIPVLPRLGLWLGRTLVAALTVITLLQVHEVGRAFAAFDRSEVGDFDAAVSSIPPAQRVAGLIFARGSRQVKFSPFIQYVAYYQARRGGAVMFSFADFPQSPFRFRDDNRPPPVPPRWEWQPRNVRVEDLAWYDYMLVRGGPSPCSRAQHGPCTRVFHGKYWEVWKLR